MITVFSPERVDATSHLKIWADQFFGQRLLGSFSLESITFLSELSSNILKNKVASSIPDLIALAYWLRKSNIMKIVEGFSQRIPAKSFIKPRGVAFHSAPSNVETIFVYSWALSLLAGNINILRVSQTPNATMDLLIDIINFTLQDFDEIRERISILTYPHDDEIASFISERADTRVIWGGDESVSAIRSLPTKPTTTDISFADKTSFSIVKSSEYLGIDEKQKTDLASKFFADAYQFNQLGCSSPRAVYFVGSGDENDQASELFWGMLNREILRRKHSDDISVANSKAVELFYQAAVAENIIKAPMPRSDQATVLRANQDSSGLCRSTCGGGFFWEVNCGALNEITGLVSPKDQTISYFGFGRGELEDFVSTIQSRGCDRIVPIGKALDFSPVWDGFDLLSELTRIITIE